MDADQGGKNRERELISFPRWAEVLADTKVSTGQREAYRRAIIAFLGYCKRRHAGASVMLIQSYLAGLPEQERSGARAALRWWYRAAMGDHGPETGRRKAPPSPRLRTPHSIPLRTEGVVTGGRLVLPQMNTDGRGWAERLPG